MKEFESIEALNFEDLTGQMTIYSAKGYDFEQYSTFQSGEQIMFTAIMSKKVTVPKQTSLIVETIEERIEIFRRSVITASRGKPYEDDVIELLSFTQYWTEHGPKDTKFRAEKEKTFGVGPRLGTWFKRKKQFDQNKKPDAIEANIEIRQNVALNIQQKLNQSTQNQLPNGNYRKKDDSLC